MREADGPIEARATELTKKLNDPNRKPVGPKDLDQAVAKLEAELREFEPITSKTQDEHAKILALKRVLAKSNPVHGADR